MALSRVVIPGDGITTLLTVSFALGYISQSDITCRVGDEQDGAGDPVYRTFTFVGPTQVQVDGDPAAVGENYVFQRTVVKDDLLVDWEDGDPLTDENLNLSQKQLMMAVHEALDDAREAIELFPDIADVYADTLALHDDVEVMHGEVQVWHGEVEAAALATATAEANAEAAATAAQASQTAAGVSASNAAASEGNAAGSASSAQTHAANAADARDAAQVAQALAVAAKDDAEDAAASVISDADDAAASAAAAAASAASAASAAQDAVEDAGWGPDGAIILNLDDFNLPAKSYRTINNPPTVTIGTFPPLGFASSATVLVTRGNSGAFVKQVFTYRDTNDTYVRTYSAGAWKPWSRVMLAGDYGLGSLEPVTPTSIDDATLPAGKYRILPATIGTKPGGWANQVFSVEISYSGSAPNGWATQVATGRADAGGAAGSTWVRTYHFTNAVWTPWRKYAFADRITMPEDHGAVGDGVTDDTTAMLAWAAAVGFGQVGVLSAKRNYRISSTLSFADQDVVIRGNGATITAASNARHFMIANTLTNYNVISGVSTVSHDFGAGAYDTTKLTFSTPANLSQYNVGDIIKVYSNQVMPTEEIDQREGEFAMVGAKDASGIILTSLLRFVSADGVRVTKLNTALKVDIRDLYLDHDYAAGVTWSNDRFTIQCAYMPRLENITFVKSAAQQLKFSSCLGQSTVNCAFLNARTLAGSNALGYGINESHCEYGEHINPYGFNCRHVFTTTAQSTSPNDGDARTKGRNKFARIIGGRAWSCTNAAWDTHADSFMTEFVNCVSSDPYAGDLGVRQNFQLRGTYDRCDGCKSNGGRGFHINRNGTVTGETQSWNCALVNCEHTGDPADTTASEAAIWVNGLYGTPVKYLSVDGFVYRRNGSRAPLLNAETVEVHMENIKCLGTVTAGGNLHDFVLRREGVLRLRGGYTDNQGSTTASYRTFRGDEPGTEFHVKDYDIRTSTAIFAAPLSATDAAGGRGCDAWIEATTNAVPNSVTLVGTQLANNELWIDLKNTDAPNGYNSNHVTQTYGSSGNKSLSMNRRGGDTAYTAVTVTTSGVVINSVAAGRFVGQRHIIHNVGGSSNSLTVASVGGVLELGGNVVLAAGAALQLLWTGTVWVRAI